MSLLLTIAFGVFLGSLITFAFGIMLSVLLGLVN